MALSTTTEKHDAPAMKPAPVPSTTPAAPHLGEDMDPVLLLRLFPAKVTVEAARAAALAQGKATAEAGAHLVASQQEPVPPPAG